MEAERIAALMERTARVLFKGPPPAKKLKGAVLQLTVAQMRCLCTVARHENCSMRELSCHLDVRPSTACELVDGLVRSGFVQRSIDPNDRRAVCLKLAAKGRRLHEKHRAARQEHLQSVVANLSPAQRKAMVGALETLVAVLESDEKSNRKSA